MPPSRQDQDAAKIAYVQLEHHVRMLWATGSPDSQEFGVCRQGVQSLATPVKQRMQLPLIRSREKFDQPRGSIGLNSVSPPLER